jgi:phytol kinase
MNAILATIITFAIALAFLRLMDFFAQRGWVEPRLSRKLIHIGTGPIFVLCRLCPVQGTRARSCAVRCIMGLPLLS